MSDSFSKMNAWLVFLVLALVIRCSLTSSGSIAFPCKTPDEEQAYCVSLFSCPNLIKSLTTLEPEALDYVKKSICLGCEAGDFMVCCGSPKNFTKITTTSVKPPETVPVPSVPPKINVAIGAHDTEEDDNEKSTPYEAKMDAASIARREYVKNKLLPSQRICGQQHTDDRVYQANETALDEFPWIAHLEDIDKYKILDIKCNGVLISSRYVLTAGNCGDEISTVKLGQHSTLKNVTCVQESSLFVECTEPVVIRHIEKRIYNRGSVPDNEFYDLMLLKLNESVKFSDYIRPIYLPIHGSKRPTSEKYLTFSGFGAGDYDESEVLKKRITYNLTNLEVCYGATVEIFKEHIKSASTASTVFTCLVPPPGNTLPLCYGERGAPLMYKYKYKWFADAILIEVLEQDSNNCSATIPILGQYLTPSKMDWILDNIED